MSSPSPSPATKAADEVSVDERRRFAAANDRSVDERRRLRRRLKHGLRVGLDICLEFRDKQALCACAETPSSTRSVEPVSVTFYPAACGGGPTRQPTTKAGGCFSY